MATISEADFPAFIKRAGFELTPQETAEYYAVYCHVEAMAERLRTPMSYMVEPAHIYSFEEESLA